MTDHSYARKQQPNPVDLNFKFRKLQFFDVRVDALKLSSRMIVSRNNHRLIRESQFRFCLTPQQATAIATARNISPGSTYEYIQQVQLQLYSLQTTCEQKDFFAPKVTVKVNNNLYPLPNTIFTHKPGVVPQRAIYHVNITPMVKLSPTVVNVIRVSWAAGYERKYAVTVALVHKRSCDDLLQQLISHSVKHSDHTRGLIKKTLNEAADGEIATTGLRVSLMCPLGKMRMSTPCRSSTCSHLECFDALCFLLMNERTPTWNCPVCNKPALYDNLFIDGYFQDVLAASSTEFSEIQLHKDGSWSAQSAEKAVARVENVPDDSIKIISDDVGMHLVNSSKNTRNGHALWWLMILMMQAARSCETLMNMDAQTATRPILPNYPYSQDEELQAKEPKKKGRNKKAADNKQVATEEPAIEKGGAGLKIKRGGKKGAEDKQSNGEKPAVEETAPAEPKTKKKRKKAVKEELPVKVDSVNPPPEVKKKRREDEELQAKEPKKKGRNKKAADNKQVATEEPAIEKGGAGLKIKRGGKKGAEDKQSNGEKPAVEETAPAEPKTKKKRKKAVKEELPVKVDSVNPPPEVKKKRREDEELQAKEPKKKGRNKKAADNKQVATEEPAIEKGGAGLKIKRGGKKGAEDKQSNGEKPAVEETAPAEPKTKKKRKKAVKEELPVKVDSVNPPPEVKKKRREGELIKIIESPAEHSSVAEPKKASSDDEAAKPKPKA